MLGVNLRGKRILHLVNHDAMVYQFLLPHLSWQIFEGADVHLGCADWGRSDFLKGIGLKITHIPFSLSPVKFISAFLKIRKLVTSEQFDIIITHTNIAGWISRLALMSVGRKCDFHMLHASFFDPKVPFFKRYIFIVMERFFSPSTRAYISPNTFDKQYLVKHGFAAANNVCVTLGVGVDPLRMQVVEGNRSFETDLHKAEKQFIVGYLGRIIRKKGVAELLKALYIANKNSEKCIKLIVAGEFYSRYFKFKLWLLILRYNLVDKVHFLGRLENPSSFFSWIDVLILPSRGEGEGFGMVIAEAAFARKPVIVTDVPCFCDIVTNGETGLVVPRRNHRALARAIVKLSKDKVLCKKLSDSLYSTKHSYSVDEVLNRIKGFYYLYLANHE